MQCHAEEPKKGLGHILLIQKFSKLPFGFNTLYLVETLLNKQHKNNDESKSEHKNIYLRQEDTTYHQSMQNTLENLCKPSSSSNPKRSHPITVPRSTSLLQWLTAPALCPSAQGQSEKHLPVFSGWRGPGAREVVKRINKDNKDKHVLLLKQKNRRTKTCRGLLSM